MKKINVLLIAILLCIGALLQANPIHPAGKMIVKVEKGANAYMLNVHLANLKGDRTKVSLKGIDGKVWFADEVKKKRGYAKKFNVTGMPAGSYIFSVRGKEEFSATLISLNPAGITFFADQTDRSEVEYFALNTSTGSYVKEGTLIARFAKVDQNSLSIQLANLEGKASRILFNTIGSGILVKDKLEGKAGYAKKFNTKGMTSDYGYFFIETEKELLVQFFKIDKKGVTLGKMQTLKLVPDLDKYAAL